MLMLADIISHVKRNIHARCEPCTCRTKTSDQCNRKIECGLSVEHIDLRTSSRLRHPYFHSRFVCTFKYIYHDVFSTTDLHKRIIYSIVMFCGVRICKTFKQEHFVPFMRMILNHFKKTNFVNGTRICKWYSFILMTVSIRMKASGRFRMNIKYEKSIALFRVLPV